MDKFKKLLLSLLAIILIIEEWLWEILTSFGSYLSSLLRLQAFERWLSQLPPRSALTAFIIPLLIVAPINLLGFALMAHGLFLRGLMVEIFAKLLGTLLVARVFKLTRPQLLTLRWFKFVYDKIISWLSWAHQRVTATTTYRMVKQLKEKILLGMRPKP